MGVEFNLEPVERKRGRPRKAGKTAVKKAVVQRSLNSDKVLNGVNGRADLGGWLFRAADILRGPVSPENYYRFIEPLLFFKRLSDEYRIIYEEKLAEYGSDVVARDSMFYDFSVPRGCFWEDVRATGRNLGSKLNDVLNEIARANPEIDRVINRTDFNDPGAIPEEKLIRLIEYFSGRNLANRYVPPDVLGDAFEYMLKMFNETAPKRAGEFYTPREVVRLLVECVKPGEKMEVYDPCVGSGGMLIESSFYLKRHGMDSGKLLLFGQDVNADTWARAKMNLFLHGIEAFIEQGDTFQSPKFLEEGRLKTFDVVLANPMWNQKGFKRYMEDDQYRRFGYGVVNNNSADWGWIQHMLASLNDAGRMGVVLDQGALFRGGAEEKVRRAVLKDDLVECVVALPDNLFFNTGAPGCLILLNKNKVSERKEKVLFIYAAEGFEKVGKNNRLRDADIQRIVDVFHGFSDIDKFSRVVGMNEIKENDYNLSVTRYVDIFDQPEPVDIQQVWNEIKELEKQKQQTTEKLAQYLKELGYETY